MGRRIRKWKRRKGGIYAWRTRKHAHPTLREWGYVGLTNSFARRARDHKGETAYLQADGTIRAASGKPWMDLDPVVYRVIRLPWWLCWHWVMRPLETLVMLALWPRYNDAKNHWNPRRVALSKAKAQRAERAAGGAVYRTKVRTMVFGRHAVQAIGIILILVGVYGAYTTHR